MVIRRLLLHPKFSGVHGNDERLAVEQLRRGVKIYYTVLQQFTARR